MSEAINSIRAFLREFRSSPLSELYVSGKDFEYFLTRRIGSTNPLMTVAPDLEAFALAEDEAVALATTRAPHLGIFRPAKANGLAVHEGELVAEIGVLDRVTSVIAQSDGILTNLAGDGELVEYGAAIISLSAPR